MFTKKRIGSFVLAACLLTSLLGFASEAFAAKFVLNDRVIVSSGPLNVRATPSISGTKLGTQSTNALGTIVGGPTVADGYTWWKVDYDAGVDGWSIETHLEKYVPPSAPTTLQNGVTLTNLSGTRGNQKMYQIAVPAGATNLKFVTANGSGDSDIYVKFGSLPAIKNYDFKGDGPTTAETITIASPQAGTYYLLLNAYKAYSEVSLTASYATSGVVPPPAPAPTPVPAPAPAPSPTPTPTPPPSAPAPTSTGNYLQAQVSGMCLKAQTTPITDGTPIVQDVCGASSLVWNEVPNGTAFNLKIYGTNYCLNISGDGVPNGAAGIIYTCNSLANELFTTISYPNNLRAFKANSSGRCLDITNHSTLAGALLQQWDCTGETQQQFATLPAGTAVTPPPAPAPSPTPTPTPIGGWKIMPLGDSITAGGGDTINYRLPLMNLLVQNGISSQFVGSNTQFTGGFPAGYNTHEGHSGWCSTDAGAICTNNWVTPALRPIGILEHIDQWVATYQPNIVLLDIGTNDTDKTPSVMASRVGQIVDKIHAYNPSVKVLVGNYHWLNVAYTQQNAALQAMVATKPNTMFVDIFAGINDSTDFVDTIHPNATGHAKLAANWFAAIKTVIQSTSPSPAPAPAPSPSPVPSPSPTPTPPASVTYTPNTADIPNPERGFYYQALCGDDGTLSLTQLKGWRTNEQLSMVRCLVHLANYKNTAIPQSSLDHFQQNMDTLRAAGLKTVLRFSYTDSTTGDDAPVSRVMSHVDQLAPYLQKNSDVIASLEVGFIGAWGEGAYSQNFGTLPNLTTQNWTDRKALFDKLLQVMPPERMIGTRYPDSKRHMYSSTALTDAEAFNGTPIARVAHFNDCFLAGPTDWGTYLNIPVEYPYLAQETKHLVISGETCNYNPPRSDCPTAVSELKMFHWSEINIAYHQGVLDSWKTGGCFNDIKRNLGYRFVLQSGQYPTSANPGSTITISFTLNNVGYSAPYNPRNAELILRNTSTGAITRLPLTTDPRFWLPGSPITVNQNVNIPTTLPAGTYALLLNLPDPKSTLSARPEYSIQLANTNVWEAATGFNNLNQTMTIGGAVVSPSPSPTPAPTPSPTPTPPPSTKFALNDRIQVSSGPVNVRTTPSTTGTLLGTQANGIQGTVIGGPVAADGYNWWQINYDSGVDGWSVENYLTKVTTITPPPPAPAPSPSPTPTACTLIPLDASTAVSDGGYAYAIFKAFGVPADNSNAPTQSPLRLFENGIEVGPAHSGHVDIRNLGAGRFSHWADVGGTGEALRFSATNNTDPRTNGKSYAYCTGGGSPTASLAISSFTPTSDSVNAYYTVNYNGSPSLIQVFIDANQSVGSGYSIGGIGAEYLIENGNFYGYSGTGGTNWAWSLIKPLPYTNANGVAKATLARSDLGNPSAADLIARVNDQTTSVMSAKVTQSFAPTFGLTYSDNATNVNYKLTYTGTPSFIQVFLDTDQNVGTGYGLNGIGANYLIENGRLYSYSGSAGAWSWTFIKNVTYINANNIADMTVLRSDLGNPSAIDLIGAATGAGTTAKMTQVLSPSCVLTPLNASTAVSDGGYAYAIFKAFGVPADNSNAPTQSPLRLFENGIEVGPAHSGHVDIRNLGAGRFSHWADVGGTGEALRFSATNNTDPRTNGKSYAYCTTP